MRSATIGTVIGALWSWAALATSSLVLPGFLGLAVGATRSGWYQAAAGSLLLPVTLARTAFGEAEGVQSSSSLGGVTPRVAIAAAAAGCALGLAISVALRVRFTRRSALSVVTVLALAAASSSVGLVAQWHGLTIAERDFVAASGFASPDPVRPNDAVVNEARNFTGMHPNSRWAPEALRVMALDASAHGKYREAAETWMRFAGSFAEPGLPGVAYGEYSAALCEEQLGDVVSARRLYAMSAAVISRRGGDVQGWIAASAARHIARIDASRAMNASSEYWLAKAAAFNELYGSND